MAGALSLNIKTTSTDIDEGGKGGKSTLVTEDSFTVSVSEVADSPTLSVQNAIGVEDAGRADDGEISPENAIALNIQSAGSIDTDGSETVTIEISEIPDGVQLYSDGNVISINDGSATLSSDQLSNLTLVPVENSHVDFALTVTATSTESNGDSIQSAALQLPVSISPIADVPSISVASSNEDGSSLIKLDLSAQSPDNDSETLTYMLEDIPSGAVLVKVDDNGDVITNGDGSQATVGMFAGVDDEGNTSWVLSESELANVYMTPPADAVDEVTISFKVTTVDVDSDDNSTDVRVTETPVTLQIVETEELESGGAGQINLSAATDSIETDEGSDAISLGLSTAIVDGDANEQSYVQISGVPEGARLSAGASEVLEDGSTVWNVPTSEIDNLDFVGGKDFSDVFTLTAQAFNYDLASGDFTSSEVQAVEITVNPVADEVVISDSTSMGQEGNEIPLNLNISLTDTDGSETLTITFSDVPEGATISDGVNNYAADADGKIEVSNLSLDSLGDLTITAPASFSGQIELGVEAVSVDSNGVTTDQLDTAATSTLTIDIAAQNSGFTDASDLTVNVGDYSATADGIEVPLSVSGIEMVDTDGSEIISVNIQGLEGTTVSYNGEAIGEARDGGLVIEINPAETPNYQQILSNLTVSTTDVDKLEGEIGVTATTIELSTGETTSLFATTEVSEFTTDAANAQDDKTLAADEDTSIDLNLELPSLSSQGGAEERIGAITLDDIPAGAQINNGAETVAISQQAVSIVIVDENGDVDTTVHHADMDSSNAVTMTQTEFEALSIKPANNSDTDFDLSVSSTAYEVDQSLNVIEGIDGTENAQTIAIDLSAVADAPEVSIELGDPNLTTDNTYEYDLDITATLTDTDGSESIQEITVSNLPSGATLSSGTNNGDGSWSLTADQLDGLTLTIPQDAEEFDIGVTATSVDGVSTTTSEAVAETVEIDSGTMTPTVDVMQPSNDHTPTISGSAEANSTVTISDTDGNEIGSSATDANGQWSYEFSDDLDDDTAIVVTATDETGNKSAAASFDVLINQDPSAVDDVASTDEDSVVVIDPLANDSDSDGDQFSLTSVESPVMHNGVNVGTAEIVDGKIQFTPTDGMDALGEDEVANVSFNYSVTDQYGADSSATIQVNVTGLDNDNPAPAISDVVDVHGDLSEIQVSGTGHDTGNTIVLYNAEGQQVASTNVQADGTWTANIADEDNGVRIEVSAKEIHPNGVVSDASNSVNTLQDNESSVVSNASDDYIFTGREDDSITVADDNANDGLVVDGGDGIDTVKFTGNDNEVDIDLAAQTATVGDDTIDVLNVESVYGSDKADTITGDDANNKLFGDDGADTIHGGAGDDEIIGDHSYLNDGDSTNDNDSLFGDAGNDAIHGGVGDDTLSGGSGDDELHGGADTDTAVFSGNQSDYTITEDKDSQTLTITDNRDGSPDGIDVVHSDVEKLQFSDGKVTFDSLQSHDVSAVTDIDDSANQVAENVAIGTSTGVTLKATDADGDAISYSVEGDVPFTVGNDGVVVTSGDIDFESKQSYTFDVKATSADGTTSTESITINVKDIQENVGPDATDDLTINITGATDLSAIDLGDMINGADAGVTVTGLFEQGSSNNLLDGIDDALVTSNSHKLGNYWPDNENQTGYNYMGGHDWFEDHGITQAGNDLDGGIVTFSDGSVGVIDYISNGGYAGESSYIYYKPYENLENSVISTNEDTSITITSESLLSNDTDANNDTLTISSVQEASHGSVEINDDGNIVFTPDENYHGEASFTYTIIDGNGGSDTATVTLEVDSVNDVITQVTDSDSSTNEVAENVANGAKTGVTLSATDADGEAVTYSIVDDVPFSVDSNGVIVTDGDIDFESKESYTFDVTATSADGSTSTQEITIDVTDIVEDIDADGVTLDLNLISSNKEVKSQGQGNLGSKPEGLENIENISDDSILFNNFDTATDYGGDDDLNVHIAGNMNRSIDLGDGDNILEIDNNAQQITTGSGDDTINIDGNQNRNIEMGDGDNRLDVDGNSSNIFMRDGDDSIRVGGNLNLSVDLNGGDNTLDVKGNAGGNIYSDKGNDTVIVGGNANRNISVGDGDDTVYIQGNTGGQINLGDGDDTLTLKSNSNRRIYAEEGDDTIVLDGSVGDYIMGGSGNDSIVLNHYSKADWDSNRDNIQGRVKEFENIKFNDGEVIGDESAFSTEDTTNYETTIGIKATQADTDGSETLSEVTINVPDDTVSVEDKDGNELTVSQGQVNVPVQSGVATTIVLTTSEQLSASDMSDITGSVTSTENKTNASKTATDALGHDISQVTDSDDSNNSVAENSDVGTYTGITLKATDEDGDAIQYSVDSDSFTVNENGEIVTAKVLDFETKESYTFDVTATSADGSTSTETVTIDVADLDDNLTPSSKPEVQTLSLGSAETSSSTNVTFIVDVSSSMSNSDLSLTEAAIAEIVDKYDSMGDVNVNVIQFWGNGNEVSGWQDADSEVSLYTNKSGTDPEQGLSAAMDSYDGTQPDADNQAVFVFSDGNSYGAYETDFEKITGDGSSWNQFIADNNVDLHSIGINVRSLSDLDTIASAGDHDPQYVADVSDLASTIESINVVPEVTTASVTGKVKENVSGGDGEISVDSITIGGVTYNSESFPEGGLNTDEGAVLHLDFESGIYTYRASDDSVTSDISETFTVSVSDEDGDSTDVKVTVNVDVDDTASVSTANIDVGDVSKVEASSEQSFTGIDVENGLDNFESNADKSYSKDASSEIKGTRGDDDIFIGKDANKEIELGDGDDNVYIGDDAEKEIDLGSGNDSLYIVDDAKKEIKAGDGDDQIYIGDKAEKEISLEDGDDYLAIGGDAKNEIKAGDGDDYITVGKKAEKEISLGDGDDYLSVGKATYKEITAGDGNDYVVVGDDVNETIDGGAGTDSIELKAYSREDYDDNKDDIQENIENFENIKFSDGSVIGDSSAFESNSITGYEYPISIKANLVDTDGSESISEIVVSGFPSSAVLSSGIDNYDGSWSLTSEQLEGLSLTIPDTETTSFNLSVAVTTTESNGGDTSVTTLTTSITPGQDAGITTIETAGGAGDDTFTGGKGDDTFSGGDGDDTYFFNPFDGNDEFHGGEGGWTDIIHLDATADPNADPNDPWTITVDGEEVDYDLAAKALDLDPDSSGVVSLSDGSQLTFDGVDKIEWGN